VSDQNDLLGVPGFFAKEGTYGSYWTMAGAAGLMIPFRSITNEITGNLINSGCGVLDANSMFRVKS
jgi:hypothetical protein